MINSIKIIITIVSLLFISCGIEEYYYLPQVPDNINREGNWAAEFTFPPIDRSTFYYAKGYAIYYRIYISEHIDTGEINTEQQRTLINTRLNQDFRSLEQHTDPTINTFDVNRLFTSLRYFQLNFEDDKIVLSANGGLLTLFFPNVAGGIPFATLNDGANIPLCRPEDLLFNAHEPYFQNSADLNTESVTTANNDVQRRDVTQQQTAYVNMYIVAVGNNPVNFSQIYSKPTHIGIFRLPDH